MTALKTIVVHLPDIRRAERLLRIAVPLARDHDAHLVGLFVTFPDLLSPPLGMGRALIASALADLKAQAERISQMFEGACAGQSFRSEWRFVDPGRGTAIESLLTQARAADLLIASQPDPDWSDTLLLEHTEDLLLHSGRPVLFVPNAGEWPAMTERILVSWNERREAARAAFDALPLLQRARDVRVLWVNPDQEWRDPGDVPTADIVRALARHGVAATAAQTIAADLAVGDELLNQAADHGSTLIVMGGYGHHRLRQYVFGGATRHMLQSMTVPVLMSH